MTALLGHSFVTATLRRLRNSASKLRLKSALTQGLILKTLYKYMFAFFFVVRDHLCLSIITEISKVLTARLGIQNAQSHLINRFQNSLKSRGQKS